MRGVVNKYFVLFQLIFPSQMCQRKLLIHFLTLIMRRRLRKKEQTPKGFWSVQFMNRVSLYKDCSVLHGFLQVAESESLTYLARTPDAAEPPSSSRYVVSKCIITLFI